MKELLDLFLTFARIGGLTFGGGYAMLPMLQREVVERRGWATEEELMDYYAIGQCTPGVVFPSIVIITVIAAFISNFSDLQVVKDAFAGIRVCVFVLILNAVIKLGKASVKDAVTLGICLAVLLGSVLLDLSPIIFVVLAAVAGIVAKVLLAKEGK